MMRATAICVLLCALSCGVTRAEEPEPTAVDPDALLHALKTKLEAVLRERGVDAPVTRDGSALTVAFRTRTFQVHSIGKDGRISAEAHEEIGPSYRGFVLSLRLNDGAYGGAAEVPQTLRRPYWQTYVDAYALAKGKRHLKLAYSYGVRTDPKILEHVRSLLDAELGAAAKGGDAEDEQK